MYYYFSEIDLKNYNPALEIKKILDFDIDIEDKIYRVWVVYLNKNDVGDSFFIEFYIDDSNYLKVIKPPTKLKKVTRIDETSIEGKKILELLNNYPIDKSGRPKIPPEEIEKILQQYKKKQEK